MTATARDRGELLPTGGSEALGETMRTVLGVLREHGRPMTDEELRIACNLRGGKVRPARLRLYRRGLVEPSGSGAWQLVEADRCEEVRAAARARPPRRRGIDGIPLDERVATVVALLDDDQVNDAVRRSTTGRRAWRRASARAHEIQTERERERRARRLAALRAEQLCSPLTAFLKMRNHLKDAVEVMLGLYRLLADDAASVSDDSAIPRSAWPDLARNVRELVAAAASVEAMLEDADGPLVCPFCHRPSDGQLLTHVEGGWIDEDCIDVRIAGAA